MKAQCRGREEEEESSDGGRERFFNNANNERTKERKMLIYIACLTSLLCTRTALCYERCDITSEAAGGEAPEQRGDGRTRERRGEGGGRRTFFTQSFRSFFPREDKKATFQMRPARALLSLLLFLRPLPFPPLRTEGGNWSCCGDNLLPGYARDSAHAQARSSFLF